MKRSLILLIFILVSAGARAQTISDKQLIGSVSFEDHEYEETLPEGLSASARTAAIIGRQLTGDCYFEPECYMFVRQAIDSLGIIPGLIITADRLTRCSRIGTSQHHHFNEDGKIHEGVEVYMPKKRRK